MNGTSDLLKQLVKIPSVSGYEKVLGITDFVKRKFINLGYRPEVDFLGSVLAKTIEPFSTAERQKADKKVKILFTAHIDEVGFMASKILKNKIKFVTCGGIDPKSVIDQDLVLYNLNTQKNYVVKPISKTRNPRSMNSFWINRPKSISVQVLDPLYFQRRYTTSSGGRKVTAPSLDNKVGVCVLLKLAEMLKDSKTPVAFLGVAQEETTGGGLLSYILDLKPDIIIDMDAAYGQLDSDSKNTNIPILGQGAALQTVGRGLNFEKSFFIEIVRVLRNRGIPYQFELPEPSSGGTIISSVTDYQKCYLQVNVPVMAQHSAKCVTCVDDIGSAVEICKTILQFLEKTKFNNS